MAKAKDLGTVLVENLKGEWANAADFKAIYITPRDEAFPDSVLGDDVMVDIRRMFMRFLNAITSALKVNRQLPDFVWEYVTPYYDNSCDYLVVYQGRVLYKSTDKPWAFYFETLTGLKEEMVRIYKQMEANLDKHLEEQKLLEVLRSNKVSLVDLQSIVAASVTSVQA